MSNYPNMSYCQCENTLLALQQVMNSMEDGGTEFVRELSRTERRSYDELMSACEAFIRMAEDMEQELREEDYDGQPDEAQEWHDFDPDC
jgi:hypothetical protein